MKIRLAAFTAVFLVGLSSVAHADVIVNQAYGFAMAPGAKTGAAFMRIDTDMADRLVGVETPVSPRAELHVHLHEDGVMKMRKVDGLDVDVDTGLVLEPGGNHVMLLDMPAALQKDQTFPLTLVFEKAGRIETTVLVRASGDVPDDHRDHDHDHGAH